MRRVVVTDGEQRAALAAVRSLGLAGYRVSVCASTRKSLAGASRFAEDQHLTPSPLQDPVGFLEATSTLCQELKAAVLLPITDAALEAILPARSRFQGTHIPFAEVGTYRRASDKAALMLRARALGIPAPEELRLESPQDALDESFSPRFPLVIKPSKSVVVTTGGKEKVSVKRARDRTELEAGLRELPEGAYPLLLQENIEGHGEGGFFLIRDGQPLAEFAHRRIREKPPSGGVSVYRESVPMAEDVRLHSLTLLRDLDWSGVAMVEFRRSSKDGQPYLMEINGRFWGSLQLAIDAGVDFPRLLVESALSLPTKPVREYRAGIRSRWWLGDLDHLLIRIKGGVASQHLASELGSTLGALSRFLIPWRPGDRSEVMRISDPGPGLREVIDWARDLWTGRTR